MWKKRNKDKIIIIIIIIINCLIYGWKVHKVENDGIKIEKLEI